MAPVRPAHVTTINLDAVQADEQWIDAVEGDACNLPGPVRRETFDLVFSNSLMEHVGGHAMRQRFAQNVHACAPRHWVQTPYRYFPIEPHWLFPAMQFLPYEIRVRISQGWHLGHMKTYTRAAAEDLVNEVELIGVAQMRTYFLESEIWRETFAGLTKSLGAVR